LKALAKLIYHPDTPSCYLTLLHRLAAADKLSFAGLGDDEFGAALGAEVALADLVSHVTSPANLRGGLLEA
jgi:hypothetical protein